MENASAVHSCCLAAVCAVSAVVTRSSGDLWENCEGSWSV